MIKYKKTVLQTMIRISNYKELCREPVAGENRTISVVKYPFELQAEIAKKIATVGCAGCHR